MKWDFYQYLNQPEWFIELIKEKLKIDSQKLEEKIKRK